MAVEIKIIFFFSISSLEGEMVESADGLNTTCVFKGLCRRIKFCNSEL